MADLEAARLWLTQPGAGRRALGRLQRIRAALDSLADGGPAWPVGDHPGVRERPIEGYRILYRIEEQPGESGLLESGILVVRVFGPGQDRGRL